MLEASQLAARAEIAQLIQRWAFSRDNARWDELDATFSKDGEIAVSWFKGLHSDFVRASRERHGRGFNRHVMLGTRADVRGPRACAESDVMMIGFGVMDGIAVRWTCHFRFIDLMVHDGVRWMLRDRTAVYDMDSLDSDVEGTHIAFDADKLSRIPRPYRYLGYRLSQLGLTVPMNLPTAGSAAETQLRAQAQAWIGELIERGPAGAQLTTKSL